MLSDLQRMMSPATADSSAALAASAARVFSGIKSLHVVCKTGVRPKAWGDDGMLNAEREAATTDPDASSAIASLACTCEATQSVGTAERVPAAFVALACAAQESDSWLVQPCCCNAVHAWMSVSKAGEASVSAGAEDAAAE